MPKDNRYDQDSVNDVDDDMLDDDQDTDELGDEDEGQNDAAGTDDDGGADEDQQPRRGNVAKALQEERRANRELRQQLAESKQDAQRAKAFAERFGNPQSQQRPQHSQQEVDAYRAKLADRLLSEPDVVLNELAHNVRSSTEKSVLKRFAPALATTAERIIASNAKHKECYDVPEIKQVVDDFIIGEIEKGAIDTVDDLQEVVTNVMNGVVAIRGTNVVRQDNPARKRMSSVAQKGGGGSSGKASVQELFKLAQTNPRKYHEELKKPENRKLVNEQVFRRQS